MLAVSSSVVTAQSDYPSKPITIVIPTAASVSGDLLMRALSEVASRHLKQPIIVDNKAGGSGALAAAFVAAAKPDGYTLLNKTLPMYRIPLMQKTTYDPVKDFTPVILLASYTLGVAVKGDGPFKQWSDVVKYSKESPGKFTYTTVGPHTTNAIAMEAMSRKDGIQFTHVPSKGGGEGIALVLGGHVMGMVESPAWGPLVASGEMRLLMLLNSQRSKKWPNVPALPELGYDFNFDAPYSVDGPKGLDPSIVKKLHDAFRLAYDDPKVIEAYEKFDFVRRYANTEDYAKYVPTVAAQERTLMDRLGLSKKE